MHYAQGMADFTRSIAPSLSELDHGPGDIVLRADTVLATEPSAQGKHSTLRSLDLRTFYVLVSVHWGVWEKVSFFADCDEGY